MRASAAAVVQCQPCGGQSLRAQGRRPTSVASRAAPGAAGQGRPQGLGGRARLRGTGKGRPSQEDQGRTRPFGQDCTVRAPQVQAGQAGGRLRSHGGAFWSRRSCLRLGHASGHPKVGSICPVQGLPLCSAAAVYAPGAALQVGGPGPGGPPEGVGGLRAHPRAHWRGTVRSRVAWLLGRWAGAQF